MENIQPELKEVPSAGPEDEVIVGRHFEDVDDLTYNRDAPLKPLEEETIKLLDSNAREIIRNTEAKKSHKILIVSSPKERATHTAKMLKECIQKINPDLLVHIQPDNHFAELYQGELILPHGYHKGDRVSTLPDAWAAFWKETFTEAGEYNNPNYRFGDPVYLKENIARYPELVNRFSSYGESYRELCLRYYQGLVAYFENSKRVKDAGINVILVGHGATIGILSGLEGVLHQVKDGTYVMETGSLMRICRQEYMQQRMRKETQNSRFGDLRSFSLKDVNDDIVNLLREEIDFLKVPENYEKKA